MKKLYRTKALKSNHPIYVVASSFVEAEKIIKETAPSLGEIIAIEFVAVETTQPRAINRPILLVEEAEDYSSIAYHYGYQEGKDAATLERTIQITPELFESLLELEKACFIFQETLKKRKEKDHG